MTPPPMTTTEARDGSAVCGTCGLISVRCRDHRSASRSDSCSASPRTTVQHKRRRLPADTSELLKSCPLPPTGACHGASGSAVEPDAAQHPARAGATRHPGGRRRAPRLHPGSRLTAPRLARDGAGRRPGRAIGSPPGPHRCRPRDGRARGGAARGRGPRRQRDPVRPRRRRRPPDRRDLGQHRGDPPGPHRRSACPSRSPTSRISSREVDLDAATTSVRYGEVDVAFGLDYLDAPMPGDKSIQLVRLPPEKFAVAVATGSLHPVARRRRPRPSRVSTSGPSCSATWTGSCPRRPLSTVAPSARDSGAWASSRGWCTR